MWKTIREWLPVLETGDQIIEELISRNREALERQRRRNRLAPADGSA